MRIPLLSLSLAAALSLVAEDWPRFRGPNGDGVSPNPIATKLDAASVRWAVDLPGRGLSSPVISGDRLFVTCSSGPRQDRLHVRCLRVADGSLLWERQFWATGRTMTHEKICGAVPTPVLDGNRVFALFSSNDCVALDFDGNLLWYRGLGRDYPNASNSLGMSSSLVVAEGTLVVQIENDSESFAAGLDPADGTNRWKVERPRRSNWTSPTLIRGKDGKTLAVIQSSKGVVAIDPKTGATVWNYDQGASTAPSTTVSGGRLYVPSNGLTVLEPAGAGEPPRQAWRSAQLRPGTASPVVVGDLVLVVSDSGILTAGSVLDGKRLWQLRLKGESSSSTVTATPVAAGGHLYCVNEAGVVQVVKLGATEGTVVSSLELGQPVLGTPSIAQGSLFVRSDGKLWRIGGALN
ncbi:MAG: PQQ-binding-like beta-propeller repeat protein [Verrucomicrobia bacterium]|nr:MAG: PQQ-binding-like beta-propeller repeat protein [Verrucomicrobiota bacterium]